MDKWTFEVATQQQEQLNYMRKQMETTQGELAEVKAHMSCQGKVIRQLKRLVKAMQPSPPKRKLVASSHPEVIIPEPTRYSSVDPLNPSRYTNHGDPVPREYPSLEDDDDTPFTFQRQRSRSPRIIPHL